MTRNRPRYYGRVSYTPLEFIYTSAKGKKTKIIVTGEGFRRHKPIPKISKIGNIIFLKYEDLSLAKSLYAISGLLEETELQ
jgi:hypothetical protein